MNFEELITLLNDNQELADKMRNATSAEASYEIAREAGFVGTFEEFVKDMQNLYEEAALMDPNDLNAITGGTSINGIAEAFGPSIESTASITDEIIGAAVAAL